MILRLRPGILAATILAAGTLPAWGSTTNFESSHVHPVGLTPSGNVLVAVNTPDALLEVFAVAVDGSLAPTASIPVGLEPVSLAVRSETEVWVVNHLSDSVSVVDLAQGVVIRTLATGDEPTDVVFAEGRAFVAVSQDDRVDVFQLADLSLAPTPIPIFSREVRALAVLPRLSPLSDVVYAVPLKSGNGTTVLNAPVIHANDAGHDAARVSALGLEPLECSGAPPAYPPLPTGVVRNPALTDPPYQDPNTPGVPPVGLIVRWNGVDWVDEVSTVWTPCLPFRLPDEDLFAIDAGTLAVSATPGLGTTLFDVSVHPGGKLYVPHTEARNHVRFEHPLGVQGHVVDNRMAVVDPSAGHSVTLLDLNAHVVRTSVPPGNLGERQASISQPGMLVWNSSGTRGYLTAIGSGKLFVVDGTCLAPACIFGPDRAVPWAVDTGGGPTGVALHEGHQRAYVLNRFDNSIALVDTAALTLAGTVPLHDPSPPQVKNGRRLLYDAVVSSAHGDAACSSCHISGDTDGLAWDLGDPSGDAAAYTLPQDNVRFVVPFNNQPAPCDPSVCAAHLGFDPQKGPMTTQTLRGMLEPLHWRGDRATFESFNKAFPGLLGSADVGPVNGEAAGLPAGEMSLYRDFILEVAFPPNPYRTVNDQVPNAILSFPGLPNPGNPRLGEIQFSDPGNPSDAGQHCASCHTLPFGAAGGTLGGVDPGGPGDPTPMAAAALFNGDADLSPHSDLKVPHLRNMYEKFGPVFGPHGAPPDRTTGFGFIHDGSMPDMNSFLSASVFTLTADEVKHLSAFMYTFPTGTRPAVGRHLTLPAGGAAGTAPQEALLTALLPLGDVTDPARHCELTASTLLGGLLTRLHYTDHGGGGVWLPDRSALTSLTTAALRAQAQAPVSFLCAPLGSGARLGGDRDEDGAVNGDDCAEGEPSAVTLPLPVSGLEVDTASPTGLTWDGQPGAGSGTVYDLVGFTASALRSLGLSASSCLAGGLTTPAWSETAGDPPPGDAFLYLPRARNACGDGGYGPGRSALDAGPCPL